MKFPEKLKLKWRGFRQGKPQQMLREIPLRITKESRILFLIPPERRLFPILLRIFGRCGNFKQAQIALFLWDAFSSYDFAMEADKIIYHLNNDYPEDLAIIQLTNALNTKNFNMIVNIFSENYFPIDNLLIQHPEIVQISRKTANNFVYGNIILSSEPGKEADFVQRLEKLFYCE